MIHPDIIHLIAVISAAIDTHRKNRAGTADIDVTLALLGMAVHHGKLSGMTRERFLQAATEVWDRAQKLAMWSPA